MYTLADFFGITFIPSVFVCDGERERETDRQHTKRQRESGGDGERERETNMQIEF